MIDQTWIHVDEASDVAGSIRHALRSAAFILEDPLAWKWVILALHSALQGACICHLTTTAHPIGALTQKSTDQWWAWLNGGRNDPKAEPPLTQLKRLPELLKKVRKPNTVGSGELTPGISISDAELQWLHRIHRQVRNQFVHFEPTGWSIEVSGVLELGRLIGRIIAEIAAADWAFRDLSPEEQSALLKGLDRLSAMDWLPKPHRTDEH